MSKKIAVIVLFLALLTVPTVYWLVSGQDSVALFDTEKEKRQPTAFPDVGLLLKSENESAAFFSQTEEFYNDRLPFRNYMIKAYSDLNLSTSGTYTKAVEDLFNTLHVHRFTKTVTPATCTEDGYTEYACICGETYREDERKALGHEYRSEIVEPTCTQEGYTVHRCTRCSDSYTDTPTATVAHAYETSVTSPTCTEEGYTTYRCSVCGDTYRDDFTVAFGHDFGDPEIVREASCENGGLITVTCKRCRIVQTVDVTQALGHDYSEWTVTEEATTEKAGSRRRTCNRCNKIEIRAIPVLTDGHTHAYVLETIPATCTENGYESYVCSCGDRYEGRVIPASHDYVLVASVPSCDTDGSETYRCSRCGEEITKTVPQTGHDYVFSKTVKPTCVKNGYDVYVCSHCGAERQSNVVRATNVHDWGSWKTVKEATFSADGEKTRVCKNCGEKQTAAIPKLTNSLKDGTKTPNGYIVGSAVDTKYKRLISGVRSPDGYFVINDLNNWILFTGDGNNSCYNDLAGNGLYSLKQKQDYAQKIAHLDEVCRQYGKTLVLTVCPNKSNVYSEYMNVSAAKVQRVDSLMKYLEENTSVKIVWSEALEEMKTFKRTYELYFRYDSHWNAAGGFVWANNILRTIGLPYTSLYEVPLTVKTRQAIGKSSKITDCLIGTSLYGIDWDGDLRDRFKTGQYAADDHDFVINYLPGVSYSIINYRNDRNSYYKNPEYTGIIATSTSANKQSCVLIGDSFRRALNPVLVKNFKNYLSYHYVDIGTPECQKAIRSSDVIVLECTERLFDLDNFELFATVDIIERLEYYITH